MNRLEETPSLVTNTCSGEPAFGAIRVTRRGPPLLLHLPIDAEHQHLHQRCAVDAQGDGVTCWSIHQNQTRATCGDTQRRVGNFQRARRDPLDLNVIKALHRRSDPELTEGFSGFPALQSPPQQIPGASTHQMLYNLRMNTLPPQRLPRRLPVAIA